MNLDNNIPIIDYEIQAIKEIAEFFGVAYKE